LSGNGAGAVLVPVGGVILLLLVAYMVSTWTQDRRREGRRRNGPGTAVPAEANLSTTHLGSSTPEGPALLP
jgi:hypothetical protein